MKRIMIVGSGGAGKSTLALQIGKKLNLPVVHLDREFWRPGWTMPSKEEWTTTVSNLIQNDKWILDGNFDRSIATRLQAADTLIYLDFHPLLCLFRVIKRRIKHHSTHRPDMTPGCNEQLDRKFLTWILRFRKDSDPGIRSAIEKYGSGKKILILRSPSEVCQFLNQI